MSRHIGHSIVTLACCFLFVSLGVAGEPGDPGQQTHWSFNRDIRPILSDACFYCHGPDSAHREADLRLDVAEQAHEDAFIGGDLTQSEAWRRIASEDPDELMPPPDSGKKLTPEQMEMIGQWIREGAPYDPYWAYVPPRQHAPPDIVDTDWANDPLDRFILAPLEKQSLRPAPDADPATLIRRVSFDLTGLPPTAEQVAAFVADPTEENYRRHVDHLFASPAYGERMAVYWLDLVRYADTVGYHGDQDHNISPYRDYVIDSLNANVPLDRFTIEQLAGDLLPDPTTDQIIATGYNRLLQTSHEGGVQPKEYLAIYAADRIRNVSAVWMGATVGCAQCHDHKYDPYRIDDFYAMSAFFADIDEAAHFKNGTNSLPTRRDPEIAVLSPWQRQWLQQIESEIEKTSPQTSEPEPGSRLAQLIELRDRLEKSKRRTMITRATQPREVRLLPRGNWLDDSGPIMQPRVPEFLPAIDVVDRRPTRLDLAQWLVDPQNGVGGLTARVFVNRFWYLMFGRGLSNSLADFGGQGSPPTHPELLDQLALDFVQSGWDIKHFLRRLVLSRSYRQSSVVSESMLSRDPYNELFARQSRYRLPAEMVRDHVLAISDQLVHRVGGASIKPYQPVGYYRHLNFPQRRYQSDTGEKQWRRGVYVHWQRQFLHPMLKAMDAPSREECTAERPRSNTPLEALVLLNDPTMFRVATGLAEVCLDENGLDDMQRLHSMFGRATGRKATQGELDTLNRLLLSERKHFADHPADADRMAKNTHVSVPATELAAWTSVARAVLNLYETVTRN
ncbi:PSD1 and planctomycete cytochrome C domain-containing protein [Stieleria varia]|uniref:Planctomycete cytochrome C n=1 Tax=Stieleria varia TaxID=2528005 RepID=A0A5C6AXS4_9BACT|nr:PSD1 and planctomycete cytochrome C domain-containing protein [Stieleria varia]TWU04540.1 Planctomycete cytochrome C [Stieleria varia]